MMFPQTLRLCRPITAYLPIVLITRPAPFLRYISQYIAESSIGRDHIQVYGCYPIFQSEIIGALFSLARPDFENIQPLDSSYPIFVRCAVRPCTSIQIISPYPFLHSSGDSSYAGLAVANVRDRMWRKTFFGSFISLASPITTASDPGRLMSRR